MRLPSCDVIVRSTRAAKLVSACGVRDAHVSSCHVRRTRPPPSHSSGVPSSCFERCGWSDRLSHNVERQGLSHPSMLGFIGAAGVFTPKYTRVYTRPCRPTLCETLQAGVHTLSTSAALVTSPWMTVRSGLDNASPPLVSPPDLRAYGGLFIRYMAVSSLIY